MGAWLAGWMRGGLVLILVLASGWAEAKRPSDHSTPGLSARQAALAYFRTQQAEVRAYKKRQRELRRKPEPQPPPARDRGPRRAGLACLALLGTAALAAPVAPLAPVQPLPATAGTPWGRFAPGDLAVRMNRMETRLTDQLQPLLPICAAPQLSGRNLGPCVPGYAAGVLEQLRQVHLQMAALFVPPESLGAGACRPGEPKATAEERIALDQGEVLSRFDRLAADAATLWYLLARDGFTLQAVGTPLILPEILGPILGIAPTSPAALPSFVAGEVGHGLLALGNVLQGLGAAYGQVSNRAFLLRARYQRWANKQIPRLLACADGAPVAAGPALPAPADLWAPSSAMQETVQWLQEGCAVAARHGLAPDSCGPETFQDLSRSNGTLGGLYLGLSCTSSGAQLGVQAPCRPDLQASSLDRSDALAVLEAFGAEVADVAYETFALSEYLAAGVQGLTGAATAALRLNNTGAAVALFTAANTLSASAAGLFAATYELFQLGSVCRSWQALVNQHFNDEDRAKLDRPAGSSSTGTAATGAGTASPAPEDLPELEPVSVPLPEPPDGTMASPATRPRPASLRDLLDLCSGR